MATESSIPRYGVHRQHAPATPAERAAESLRLLGFAILPAVVANSELSALRERFDAVRARVLGEYGQDTLREIDEHNTVRGLLGYDQEFLELARNAAVHEVCRLLLAPGYILNQQNAVVNPAGQAHYGQAAYHRDLPYQHFVSSRPLALNALFCLDEFNARNGATQVIPASHKEEDLPSDALIAASEQEITAPEGSFILLDCMTYHRGGRNRTERDRRAVNHVFTIGLMRQQLDLPAWLGEDYSADPEVRRLLGYDFQAPRSPKAYYEQRRRKRTPQARM